jgi:hypothetical protein
VRVIARFEPAWVPELLVLQIRVPNSYISVTIINNGEKKKYKQG